MPWGILGRCEACDRLSLVSLIRVCGVSLFFFFIFLSIMILLKKELNVCSYCFLPRNTSFKIFLKVRNPPPLLYKVIFTQSRYGVQGGFWSVCDHWPPPSRYYAPYLHLAAGRFSYERAISLEAGTKENPSGLVRRGTTSACGVPLRVTRAVMPDLRDGYSPVAGSSTSLLEGSGHRVRWPRASAPRESWTYA